MDKIMEQLSTPEMIIIYRTVWGHLEEIAGMLFQAKIDILDNTTTGTVSLSLAMIILIVLGFFLKGRIKAIALRLLYLKIIFALAFTFYENFSSHF